MHVSAKLACMCGDWRQLVVGCNSVVFWCRGKSKLNGFIELLGGKVRPQLLPGFWVPIMRGLGIDKNGGRGKQIASSGYLGSLRTLMFGARRERKRRRVVSVSVSMSMSEQW